MNPRYKNEPIHKPIFENVENNNLNFTSYENIDLNETRGFYKYMEYIENVNHDDDMYEEPVPLLYKYNGLDKLHTVEVCQQEFDHVFICAHKIIGDRGLPFLQYLLVKEPKTNVIGFPSFSYSGEKDDDIPIYESKIVLCEYIHHYNLNIDKCMESIHYKGFIQNGKSLYLFFDISLCNTNIYDIFKSNVLWLAIMDEIVNQRSICCFKINENVSDLFILNPELLFLQNENDVNYEIPIVAYIGTIPSKLTFTYTFGEPKTPDSFMGPYYYFTDYKNVINNKGNRITSLVNKEVEPQPFGIIRFAIFLKTTFVPLHVTEISYNPQEQNGDVWDKMHDSVFIGKMKLDDNGNYIENYPIWIVKDYDQQYSLSYHYMDEKNVGMIL
jgi:hypothetical protein